MVDWFKKAIMKKPPYTLGGWKKTQSAKTRRSKALSSRPKNWTMGKRKLSTARALLALSNVTKDAETKKKARADADYFFKNK
ncbi:MAG: hypothetical protein ISS36_00015 [Candidatus Aenigmarchaeota archaeon]|nr:hypothetical protein [Candidatus Aenigmarchaeota archaeon]